MKNENEILVLWGTRGGTLREARIAEGKENLEHNLLLSQLRPQLTSVFRFMVCKILTINTMTAFNTQNIASIFF
jgi:hypothetical protein